MKDGESGEPDRAETHWVEWKFMLKDRKKAIQTITNNQQSGLQQLSQQHCVLDRDHCEWQMQGERGGERYKQQKRCEKRCNDVRKVATKNNMTRRQD